ncbi:clasp N terminal-domain-containing protein [Pyronema omphalodes]|nr:clasp N terminal-domain-containing protein [Pyronema omphalodes]
MSVTDAQAHGLLELVRGHDVDRKISEFAAIKAQIKHQPSVQPEAINPLFDACRIAIASPNSSLAAQALSCLSHLTRRISLQEPARIRSQAPNVLPLLIEKLADQKERNKTLALSTIIAFYKHAPQEVERCIKEQGFANKNPRVRQESIRWLSEIHKSYPNFSFKSYTPYLMSILEDSSEHVRDTAKEVVVELFSNAPDHAKSDLKRELQKRGVRKGIATYIVQRLGIPGGEAEPATMSEDGRGHLDVPAAAPKAGAKSVGGSVAGSMASFISSVPGMELEQLEPVYVNTNRELEDIFDDMVGAFEGKESEHNWIKREQHVLKIRGLLRGNAYRDFQVTFLTKTKALLDGILKTVNSLRTTLSTTGCQLVKDLAIIAGPGLDPFVEIILVNMVKQCANTKKITSQLSNVVVVAIFANVSYHQKLLQHVHLACQDKNVQPRSYAAGWLTVILETHMDHKAQIEHSGGLDLIVKCVKRGLADANPGVRENMRATYWKVGAIWPDHANAILEGLDGSSRKLLEKTNPGVTIAAKGAAASARAPIGRAATAPARPSLRDAILASKKSKSNLKSQFSSSDVNDQTASPVTTAAPTLPASAPSSQSGSGLRAAPARRAPVQKPVAQARAASPGLAPQSSRRSSTDRGTTPLSPPTMQRMGRATTPGRQQSPLAGSRKLTVLEQLNHADWKVRVEGIVVVACILAGRSPPNYDGSKMPSLPPNDVFAPTLAKLLNDPQPEVVEHLVAPEVLVRLTDFVPLEQIIPKVILLSEGDDEQHALPIRSKSLPMLKTLFSDVEFADTLLMVIDSMTSAGVNTKKISPVSLKTNEKRTIIHGCILWMNELVEKSASGVKNEVFHEKHNYKRLINRFIQMLSTTKAPTYSALATLLKNLQLLDPATFSATLATFDRSISKELHQAWGSTDDDDIIVPEEKVAHVAEVLGEVPAVGGTTSENAEDIAMTDAAPIAPPSYQHRRPQQCRDLQ